MVDFTALLSKPAGEAKKPKALDAANYPGIIKSFEIGDANKNKTPYVRFHLAATGWPGEPQTDEEGKPIDLAKRQMRRDFFLTDDALWRLDELLKDTLEIEIGGRPYAEVLPETVGRNVQMEVQQYMNQQTNDIGNQIGALMKAE